MKVFIIFDERGRIRGSVASALHNVAVRSGEGTRVHTIERSDLNSESVRPYLRELHTNFRVDPHGEPTLVRRKI